MTISLVKKIVSGGQTGVDRAALDAALKFNLSIGGWCPKGRLAEDGVIPIKYPLQETKMKDYSLRTKLNVKDSDATLIISAKRLTGGTRLTAAYAREVNKPLSILNWDNVSKADYVDIEKWLVAGQVQVLNIAGPRASGGDDVYVRAYAIICQLFSMLEVTH